MPGAGDRSDPEGRVVGVNAPAVVFPAPGRVEIWRVTLPDVGPGDVLVRTVCSGVSQGTERRLLTDR